MKIYTQVSHIQATVKSDWSHHNHKFQMNEHVEVSHRVKPRQWVASDGSIKTPRGYVSVKKQQRAGHVGRVVAVSCTSSGRVRSNWHGHTSRMYTKYYVQFEDQEILGYDSHHLTSAVSHVV